jgi:hypothetical protein
MLLLSLTNKTSFPVRACLTKQTSYQQFGATKQVLQANDEHDEAAQEHVDAPPKPQPQPQPQPWGPPPIHHLDPSLMPQIMNAIQQGMQAGMVSFHSSYNDQYHQLVMQHFENLNANVQNIQKQFTGLTNHFYNIFPRGPPPPDYMTYPYYHPMPPQPPQEDE